MPERLDRTDEPMEAGPATVAVAVAVDEPVPASAGTAAPAPPSLPLSKKRSLLDMSRRRFLRTSGLTVGAVGAAAALPALPSLLAEGEADAPAASAAAPEVAADASGVTAPLTAHIADAASGELSIFVGERTILINDPDLAARLLQAGR